MRREIKGLSEKTIKTLERMGVSSEKRGVCPIMSHNTPYVHVRERGGEWILIPRRYANAESEEEEFGRFKVEIIAILSYGGASLGTFTGSQKSLNLKAHELVQTHMASLPRQHREQSGVCHAVMSNGESLFSFFI